MTARPTWQHEGLLAVPAGALLVALIAKNKTASVAAVISSADLKSPAFDGNSLKEWLSASGLSASAVEGVRLLGTSAAVQSISSKIKSIDWPEGKHVEVPGEALVHFLGSEGRIRLSQEKIPASALAPVRPESKAAPAARKKVLVIDDSETIRKLLTNIFALDPQVECVGTIDRPSLAEEAIERLKPDVITLDIHMPEMSGVDLLKRILPKHRIPVVMISSLAKEEGTLVLEALEAGAVDYIQKPHLSEMAVVAPVICEKVRQAAQAQVRGARPAPRKTAVKIPAPEEVDTSYLIAIGSSTGGTEALKEVLTGLPAKIPPIVIVQHIPAVFSKAFADRMNGICPFEVKEAEEGDIVQPSRVLIAPGGRQMKLRSRSGSLRVHLTDDPPVNRHRPSVDYLFDSIAQLKLPKVTGAILTGMGADGAKGLLNLKNAGASTIAQDEATSVVFGMPREALQIGAAEKAVPLQEVAAELLVRCALKERSKSA
jgi:two-component system, chemotaxis family, protein-glutamate methylesterase/glutaminase